MAGIGREAIASIAWPKVRGVSQVERAMLSISRFVSVEVIAGRQPAAPYVRPPGKKLSLAFRKIRLK